MNIKYFDEVILIKFYIIVNRRPFRVAGYPVEIPFILKIIA